MGGVLKEEMRRVVVMVVVIGEDEGREVYGNGNGGLCFQVNKGRASVVAAREV